MGQTDKTALFADSYFGLSTSSLKIFAKQDGAGLYFRDLRLSSRCALTGNRVYYANSNSAGFSQPLSSQALQTYLLPPTSSGQSARTVVGPSIQFHDSQF